MLVKVRLNIGCSDRETIFIEIIYCHVIFCAQQAGQQYYLYNIAVDHA